jgi:glycosyltransferase involved in cell wall biosynthesis
VRRERRVRFAAIVYDLIPLTHPQWVGRGYGKKFQHWLTAMLVNADLVLTISSYSRSVLISYAEREGKAVPRTEVLPLGAGFRVLPGRSIDQAIARLPSVYVLFVSTLEPRKNHRLLVRVWCRLIEKHGERNVPSLVFVGRVGWMIDDLMAELDQSGYLSGKIVRLADISDVDIREVYRRCLFSVFPSLVEGWGLPVAESLEQGKLCIASNRASIPEVGGDLVDYFDPDDEAATLTAVERAIFDDAYRNAREARIRGEYRPASWGGCAEALISSLERLGESDAEAQPLAPAAERRSLAIGGTTS